MRLQTRTVPTAAHCKVCVHAAALENRLRHLSALLMVLLHPRQISLLLLLLLLLLRT
jgi:hypothetical protein